MVIGYTLDTNILTGSNPKSNLLSSNIKDYRNYNTASNRSRTSNRLRIYLSEIVVKECLE